MAGATSGIQLERKTRSLLPRADSTSAVHVRPFPHPGSQEVRALVACHNDFPAGKFFGKCNAAKAELDHCFRVRRCHARNPFAPLPPCPDFLAATRFSCDRRVHFFACRWRSACVVPPTPIGGGSALPRCSRTSKPARLAWEASRKESHPPWRSWQPGLCCLGAAGMCDVFGSPALRVVLWPRLR